MPRQISVHLDLDTRAYIKGAAEAEAVTRALDEQFHSLDHNSSMVTRDMSVTSSEMDKAKKQTVDFGDKVRALVGDVRGLDNQIKAAKVSVGQLSVQFAQSGSNVDRNNLNDAKRVLSTLEKARRDILAFASSDTAQRAAQLAAAGVTEQFANDTAKLLPLAMEHPLVAGIAALAPVVGPAISGLLAGAITGAGIAGGIASAAKDPRVQAAASGFMHDISAEFFGGPSSAAFVQPTINALHILETDFKSLDLGSAFARAAPAVTVLAEGIGDFAKNLMPGFNAVLDKSVPITASFARGLSNVGHSTSVFLEDIVKGPAAVEALGDGLTGLGKALEGVGGTLHVLGDVYDAVRKLGQGLDEVSGGSLLKFLGEWGSIGPILDKAANQYDNFAAMIDPTQNAILIQSHKVTQSFQETAQATISYRTALQDLNQTMSDSIDESLALWADSNRVKQAIADATDQVAKNKGQWDQNTQAARNNQDTIERGLADAKRVYDEEIKAAGNNQRAIAAATREYDAQVRKLLDLAKQAGATQKELDQLAGTYYIKVVVSAPSKVVTAIYGGDRATDLAHQHTPGHAAGTPFAPPFQPYIAGENGPELISMPYASSVTSATQTRSWMGGGGGGGTVHHTLDIKLTPLDITAGRVIRNVLIADGTGRGVSGPTLQAAYP